MIVGRQLAPKTGKLHSLRQVRPSSRKAWRQWLQKHHASSPGIWLVYAKKHTGIPSLTYNDAVEEALCFGWIDSLLHPIDDSFFKQVFTPRKPKSAWSALNRTRVARLIKAGLMTESGMQMVRLAKKTGTWEAWQSVETLEMPPDLQKAIRANAAAKKNWPTYTASQQKAFLRMVNDAKTTETRARRVARVLDIVSHRQSFAQVVRESMKGKSKR